MNSFINWFRIHLHHHVSRRCLKLKLRRQWPMATLIQIITVRNCDHQIQKISVLTIYRKLFINQIKYTRPETTVLTTRTMIKTSSSSWDWANCNSHAKCPSPWLQLLFVFRTPFVLLINDSTQHNTILLCMMGTLWETIDWINSWFLQG